MKTLFLGLLVLAGSALGGALAWQTTDADAQESPKAAEIQRLSKLRDAKAIRFTLYAESKLHDGAKAARVYDLLQLKPRDRANKVRFGNPVQPRIIFPNDLPSTVIIPNTRYGWGGNKGSFKLVQTSFGMLSLDTRSGATKVLRKAGDGLKREAVAGPSRTPRFRGMVLASQGQIGTFEIATGEVGTLLHDTRNGEVWMLEKGEDGGLSWGSTDPDKPRLGAAYLGVSTEPAGDEQPGIRITAVYPNTAAAVVALRVGDILLEGDGKALASSDDLRKIIRAKKPEQRILLKIQRKGVGDSVAIFSIEVALGVYK